MTNHRLRYISLLLVVLCTVLVFTACDAHTHTPGEWIVDVEADCTRGGVKHNECTDCGQTVKTEGISAIGHNYVDGVCTACGTEDPDYVAPGGGNNSGGDNSGGDDKPDVCEHELVNHEAKEPTCTEKGWDAYEECSKCDYTTYAEKAALGHTEQTISGKPATCTETGLTDGVKCSVCDYEITSQQTIVAQGHKYDDKYDAECNVCGYIRDADCAHTSTEVIRGYAAACTASGLTDGEKCTKCGEITKKQGVIEALGHNEVTHEAKAPTCTEIGWDAYVTCSRCDHTTYAERAKLGHDEQYYSAKAPTCTEIGWVAYVACTRCDYTTYTEKAALGHDEVVYSGYAATCTESGLADGVKCSRCEAIFTEREVIPALGHSAKAAVGENRKEATSTVDGSYDSVVYCSGCSMEMSRESKTIPAHSHVISTSFDGSDMVYSCSVCGLNSNGSDGLEYTLNSNNTYTVKSIGNCTDEYVFIPAYADGKKVVAIGEKAFSESAIKYIGIAHTVKTIGTRTFYGCAGLTEITIPSSVSSIGTQVFYKASNLSTVYYNGSFGSEYNEFLSPSHIKKVVFGGSEIPSYVCYGSENIEEVVILDNVTNIGSCAFEGCSGLVAVHISDIASWCNIRFGSFGDSTANPLYYAKKLLLNGELVSGDVCLPDDVTSIGNLAFYGCSGITSVVIPDSVKGIGDYAFSGCSGLASVEIPDSVSGIGYYAFEGCSGLTSINIPDSVTYIGSSAFAYCTSLTSVAIPNSVASIGIYTFSNCSSLTGVTIPDSVTSIGFSAFSNCSSLTSITIPDSVTSIGGDAFAYCSSLTSITVPDSVTKISSYAFAYCSSLTIYCEAESQPSGWSSNWNYSNRPVVWGHKEVDS